MPAKNNNVSNYVISNIAIKGNLISWDNHMICIPAISQVWSGPRLREPFPVKIFLILLFITLSGQYIPGIMIMCLILALSTALWLYNSRKDAGVRWIHIRLYSGEIISFTSDSEETLSHFYDALKESVARTSETQILFDETGEIMEQEEEEETQEVMAPMVNLQSKRSSNPLVNELQKLYLNYSKKEDADREILLLINNTAELVESGNRDGMKAAFKKFVVLGLINDCNELGLGMLLQEIKSSLY